MLLLCLVQVDDILLTRNDEKLIQTHTKDLNSQFSLKELGSLHYFLGIKSFRDKTGFYLTQSKYVADLLKKLNMEGIKPISTPTTLGNILSKDNWKPLSDSTIYRKVIGAL